MRAPALLLLASCHPQRPLTPQQLCDDVGYALSSRAWSCSGDADHANEMYGDLVDATECAVTELAELTDTGWLASGDGQGVFLTEAGGSLPVRDAYACPAATLEIDCAATGSVAMAWTAMVEAEPICGQILTATGLVGDLVDGCGVEEYRGREVRFCLGATDWQAAQQTCVSHGLHLANFRDGSEQDDIMVLAGRYAAGRWWIGLTDAASEGAWRWVDGSPINNYVNWASGQPDSGTGDEDCGASSTISVPWHDLDCATALPFICEAQ